MPTPLTDSVHDSLLPLVGLLHRVLGDDIRAIHLHGSAVLAGLRPDSDLDLLVVVERPLDEERRRELVRELLRVSGAPGDPERRPVELIVVVRGEISPWRYPPRCEFLYGEWLREEYERGYVPRPEPMPDLAPLIVMTRDGDTSLYGPPPAALLPEVPHADLRRAIVAGVPDLMAEVDTDTRNVLLTLARIWTTLTTGAIRSKDAAADWALERLPAEHRPVLEWARDGYRGERGERVGGVRVPVRVPAPEGARGAAEALAAAIEEARRGA
ncbi:aminoglycoside adenylyltransferase family protein [Streptomyces sp. NPDC091377]|uniref:aminoglycoside adenylyltransferase family protein n=1 Tax=Streptomyces sp. NPDC091377 TaxID=3365995 RepID=UPI00381B80FD